MIFDDIWIFHDTCLIFCLWEPTESNNEHPWVFPPRLSLGDVTRQIWNWMCNVLGSCRTLGIAKNRRHLKKSYKVKTPEPCRGVQSYDTTLHSTHIQGGSDHAHLNMNFFFLRGVHIPKKTQNHMFFGFTSPKKKTKLKQKQ